MQYTVIIDDNDRPQVPIEPWTANVYLDDGDDRQPMGVGIGDTPSKATIEALKGADLWQQL